MLSLDALFFLICLIGYGSLWLHKKWLAIESPLAEGWQEDYPWRSTVSQAVLLSGVVLYIRTLGIELSMTLAVLLCGLAWGVEKLWLKKRRLGAAPAWWIEVVEFFPLLLLVWSVRSFVLQPYRVPSDSLQPTLLPGDFLLVNQLSYGMRFPITHWSLWSREGPKRGDIAVFHPPHDNSLFFVKRVIGLPGDRITYRDRVLYINDQKAEQQPIGPVSAIMPGVAQTPIAVEHKKEQLGSVEHSIYLAKGSASNHASHTWWVPKGQYFMMGDNRDFSGDSRLWGTVPKENLVGRVAGIFLSWDHQAFQAHHWAKTLRISRMFHGVG